MSVFVLVSGRWSGAGVASSSAIEVDHLAIYFAARAVADALLQAAP